MANLLRFLNGLPTTRDISAAIDTLLGAVDAQAARSAIDAQAASTVLTQIAAATPDEGRVLGFNDLNQANSFLIKDQNVDPIAFISWSKISKFGATELVPSGAVMHFAMSSAPSGWLKANGAAISRTTYSELFSAIGTTFGSGDGSSTFNIPDLRGEFIRSYDDGRGVDSGRSFGSFQADDIKAHNHELLVEGGLSAAETSGVGYLASDQASLGRIISPDIGLTLTSAIADFGGDESRPRNFALLACIKY